MIEPEKMRTSEHLLLSILGDGNLHSYHEVSYLYTFTLRQRDKKEFEKTLKTLLDRGWVWRSQKYSNLKVESFRIGTRGDLAFREEQIRRSGDVDTYKYNAPRPVVE